MVVCSPRSEYAIRNPVPTDSKAVTNYPYLDSLGELPPKHRINCDEYHAHTRIGIAYDLQIRCCDGKCPGCEWERRQLRLSVEDVEQIVRRVCQDAELAASLQDLWTPLQVAQAIIREMEKHGR